MICVSVNFDVRMQHLGWLKMPEISTYLVPVCRGAYAWISLLLALWQQPSSHPRYTRYWDYVNDVIEISQLVSPR